MYLEVLASFRGDPTLEADVDLIESDDDEFPTIPPADWTTAGATSDSSALNGCLGPSPCLAILKRFRLCVKVSATAADPDRTLLEFVHATYQAAAERGKWDRAALEVDPRRWDENQ